MNINKEKHSQLLFIRRIVDYLAMSCNRRSHWPAIFTSLAFHDSARNSNQMQVLNIRIPLANKSSCSAVFGRWTSCVFFNGCLVARSDSNESGIKVTRQSIVLAWCFNWIWIIIDCSSSISDLTILVVVFVFRSRHRAICVCLMGMHDSSGDNYPFDILVMNGKHPAEWQHQFDDTKISQSNGTRGYLARLPWANTHLARMYYVIHTHERTPQNDLDVWLRRDGDSRTRISLCRWSNTSAAQLRCCVHMSPFYGPVLNSLLFWQYLGCLADWAAMCVALGLDRLVSSLHTPLSRINLHKRLHVAYGMSSFLAANKAAQCSAMPDTWRRSTEKLQQPQGTHTISTWNVESHRKKAATTTNLQYIREVCCCGTLARRERKDHIQIKRIVFILR